MKTAVHITHETIRKVGGIGAVLNGLCSSRSYMDFFGRTVFYGPLFEKSSKLFKHIGSSGEVLYSSSDSHDKDRYGKKLIPILDKYGINLVYLKKRVSGDFNRETENVADVILVDIDYMREPEIDLFKYRVWESYKLQSELYENDRDYEQYLRIAIPYLEILYALYGETVQYYHFSHEYMGVLSALSALLAGRRDKTVFVGHEVSTARSIVENLKGHDLSFYNIMRRAGAGRSLEQVFGSQKHNPRNELIKLAAGFDRIFAVSDLVKEEYEFLVPEVGSEKVRVVYNGLSTRSLGMDDCVKSRGLFKKYVNNLLNYSPDVILTHVTRLVDSKGLWRDITLLYLLDEIFAERNIKGVYILLSSAGDRRPAEDILSMEREYGWPVAHREGWPDLVGKEREVYGQMQLFNARARAVRGVFLNQFGFDRGSCGLRVPAEMEFIDLRAGSDGELGFSVYEPFGIAQLETIPFGGAGIFSSSCGCSFLVEKVFEAAKIKPYVKVEFIEHAGGSLEYGKLKDIHPQDRDRVELSALKAAAPDIFDALPFSAEKREAYLNNIIGSRGMLDWEGVVKDYFIPNLP